MRLLRGTEATTPMCHDPRWRSGRDTATTAPTAPAPEVTALTEAAAALQGAAVARLEAAMATLVVTVLLEEAAL